MNFGSSFNGRLAGFLWSLLRQGVVIGSSESIRRFRYFLSRASARLGSWITLSERFVRVGENDLCGELLHNGVSGRFFCSVL